MPLLKSLHQNGRTQLVISLGIGILFGFLLQKAGVTNYDVIVGQLLLENFTVVKVMLSAVIVAMIGVHLMVRFGYAQLHILPGFWGSNLIGGLIFGVGFALLGLCPGTVAGAAGTGALDALIGGMTGMLVGAGLFVNLYPALKTRILYRFPFKAMTIQELLGINQWVVIGIMEVVMIAILVAFTALGW